MNLVLLKQKKTRAYVLEGNVITAYPCHYTKKYGYRFDYRKPDGAWVKINCRDLPLRNLLDLWGEAK